MLAAVRDVALGLIKELGECKYYNLEHIANAVEAYSPIDEISYLGYDVPNTNPVLGMFKKFTRLPNSYASVQTYVEVRYASHLDLPWRRYVVSKELCHALESDEGTHSATARSLDRLLSRFSLESANQRIEKSIPAYDAEGLAEIGALELLCPLDVRRKIYKTDDPKTLCIDYGIPEELSEYAFTETYLDIISSIFDESC